MSQSSITDIRSAVESVRDATERFLCDLIRIPSLSGREAQVAEYAAQRFAETATVERVPLSSSLREDRDYSDTLPDLEYEGRFNLRIRLPASRPGRKLLLNSHLDVVPPSEGQTHAFAPYSDSGAVHGRGACDAKGQVAAMFAASAP